MKRKTKILTIGIIITIIVGIAIFEFLNEESYPDTLTLGEDPSLLFLLEDTSNCCFIGGFIEGVHDGIDFGVNDTTVILCPHTAYIIDVKTWFNEKGGHWQTNVRLRLNDEWEIGMAFEPWALDEYSATLQGNNISVEVGQKVLANQSLGNLLFFASGAHLHFDISTYGEKVCPYQYFSPVAKVTFDNLFSKVNLTNSPCN